MFLLILTVTAFEIIIADVFMCFNHLKCFYINLQNCKHTMIVLNGREKITHFIFINAGL